MKSTFKRYLTPGKPGYVRARVGDAGRCGGVDPRRRRPGRARASGPLSAHGNRHAPAARRVPRTRRRRRSRCCSSSHTAAQVVEFATYARVFGLSRSRRVRLSRAGRKLDRARRPAAAAGRRRRRSGPIGNPREAHARSTHRLLRVRPHRHHRRDARQQPAHAVRGLRIPPGDDPVRRFARTRAGGDPPGQRDRAARRPAAARDQLGGRRGDERDASAARPTR